MADKVIRTEEEWKAHLGPERYRVLRQKGTEPPFKNRFWDFRGVGSYSCAGCGAPLFASSAKSASGSGWPSFSGPVEGAVVEQEEVRFRARVVEVSCASCSGHLGHRFSDGPPPTGLRYCINSAALEFHGGNEESKG